MTVLLGTVALEPNRWGAVDPSRRPTIDLPALLDGIADAGYDGIELWEQHDADEVVRGPLPVVVFNSYVSLDDPDPTARHAVAERVRAAGSTGVKFNVGADPARQHAYAERVADWVDHVPPTAKLLCECHAGTLGEVAPVTAELLAAAGPPDRVGAIVHTHQDDDDLRARFDAYGERIAHVHVNFLDDGRAPRLAEVADVLAAKVALVRSLGFDGTWTVEFVHGCSTERDEPEALLAQAAEDLPVLRAVLG